MPTTTKFNSRNDLVNKQLPLLIQEAEKLIKDHVDLIKNQTEIDQAIQLAEKLEKAYDALTNFKIPISKNNLKYRELLSSKHNKLSETVVLMTKLIKIISYKYKDLFISEESSKKHLYIKKSLEYLYRARERYAIKPAVFTNQDPSLSEELERAIGEIELLNNAYNTPSKIVGDELTLLKNIKMALDEKDNHVAQNHYRNAYDLASKINHTDYKIYCLVQLANCFFNECNKLNANVLDKNTHDNLSAVTQKYLNLIIEATKIIFSLSQHSPLARKCINHLMLNCTLIANELYQLSNQAIYEKDPAVRIILNSVALSILNYRSALGKCISVISSNIADQIELLNNLLKSKIVKQKEVFEELRQKNVEQQTSTTTYNQILNDMKVKSIQQNEIKSETLVGNNISHSPTPSPLANKSYDEIIAKEKEMFRNHHSNTTRLCYGIAITRTTSADSAVSEQEQYVQNQIHQRLGR